MTLKARFVGSYRRTPFFEVNAGKPTAELRLFSGDGRTRLPRTLQAE